MSDTNFRLQSTCVFKGGKKYSLLFVFNFYTSKKYFIKLIINLLLRFYKYLQSILINDH